MTWPGRVDDSYIATRFESEYQPFLAWGQAYLNNHPGHAGQFVTEAIRDELLDRDAEVGRLRKEHQEMVSIMRLFVFALFETISRSTPNMTMGELRRLPAIAAAYKWINEEETQP